MMRIAAVASHGGSILQAVIDACADQSLGAELVAIISNNSQSGALARGREAGIPCFHLSSATHPDPDTLDQAMLATLQAQQADWVLLSGYMKKLGPRVLAAYESRILNTHPALLPKYGGRGFYGRRVHEAVIQAADAESGATVHLVEAEYDTGPIIAQARLAVRPDDTPESLEERVKTLERRLIVQTLRDLASRRQAS